jgi:hypothetical protein
VLFHLKAREKNPNLTWREEMELWNRKYGHLPNYQFRIESTYALYFDRAASNLLGVRHAPAKKARRTK